MADIPILTYIQHFLIELIVYTQANPLPLPHTHKPAFLGSFATKKEPILSYCVLFIQAIA